MLLEARLQKSMNKPNKQLPTWNLTALFQDINDPKIAKVFELSLEKARSFNLRYKGKISSLSNQEIIDAIRTYEQIDQEASKPSIFAYLIFAADTSKQEHGAFMQKCQDFATKINEDLIFFDLEITNLDENRSRSLIADAGDYKHYLEKLFQWKPHRLSENEEKIFNDKAQTSGSAFTRLFEEELSQQKFAVGKGKKAKILNESQILDYLYSKDQKIRKIGSEAFTEGLKNIQKRVTFIYNTLINDKQINDTYRKFDLPESSRHIANETSPEALESLLQVVLNSNSIVQKYYHLKKKILKLEQMYDYDRYAPVGADKTGIAYESAKELVLKSFKSFSKRYHDYALKFFEGDWIDVPARDGKRGGAFCAGSTPDTHPFILLNFTGKQKDVKTLAHELGHGVHDLCMQKNSYFNYGTPLTLAETSSKFAEMLLFDNLMQSKISNKQKISLICDKLENIFASVYRQITMFKFEREAHAKRRKDGELSTDDLNKIWHDTQSEMFGDSIILTENYKIWWSYITHFFNTPFYVYAYAFGELLTLSLYAMYRSSDDKAKFADKLMDDILGAGSTKSPQEILKTFNIDLNDPNFWQKGVDEIEKLIMQLEDLCKVTT